MTTTTEIRKHTTHKTYTDITQRVYETTHKQTHKTQTYNYYNNV